MVRLFVTDTSSIISHFSTIFNSQPVLSVTANRIIEAAFTESSDVRLSIPSVVFVEIFEKWFLSEQFARKFHYQVYKIIAESPNIEIKPLEREVLENVLLIGDDLRSHDIHDKIILASAMMLNCPLITTDHSIAEYVKTHKVIPEIIM